MQWNMFKKKSSSKANESLMYLKVLVKLQKNFANHSMRFKIVEENSIIEISMLLKNEKNELKEYLMQNDIPFKEVIDKNLHLQNLTVYILHIEVGELQNKIKSNVKKTPIALEEMEENSENTNQF